MPARSRYHHGELRRALIDAALAQISAEGPGALNLRDLARRIGVSHAAPYRHFADKDALLAAIAEEGFNGLTGEMASALSRARTPLRRLRCAGLAYVRFAQTNRECFRAMFGPEASRVPSDVSAASLNGLQQLVVDCQESGDLRAGDPLEIARSAWALVHGIAQLAMAEQLGIDSAKQLDRFTGRSIDALLAGLQ